MNDFNAILTDLAYKRIVATINGLHQLVPGPTRIPDRVGVTKISGPLNLFTTSHL